MNVSFNFPTQTVFRYLTARAGHLAAERKRRLIDVYALLAERVEKDLADGNFNVFD